MRSNQLPLTATADLHPSHEDNLLYISVIKYTHYEIVWSATWRVVMHLWCSSISQR